MPKLAIVGLGCKVPGANSPDELWKTLLENDSCIRPITWGEGDSKVFGHASLLEEPSRTGFDCDFWGTSPVNAAEVDPQARWILEGVWNAMIDARTGLSHLSSRTVGVYCGVMNNDSSVIRGTTNEEFSLNSTPGAVAGLVSHFMGFTGPALDINTMCSSGLVALEMASAALADGSCDVAFVAAANWVGGIAGFRDIGGVRALSPNGLQDCLGAHPNGYVRGEASVVLMLRRVSDTVEGTERAFLEAVASVHHGRGGRSPPGTMSLNVAAPSAKAYSLAYERSCAKLDGLSKHDVGYLELHATGTVLGDEAEIQSVDNFYAGVGSMWVGGNKSKFGHTEPVSGLLSIAKLCLAMQRDIMPATLMLSDPAPSLQALLQRSTVKLMTAPLPLSQIDKQLFGLTSSGMSGTTTHVLLSRPRPPPPPSAPQRLGLVSLYAHSLAAAHAWKKSASELPQASLAAVSASALAPAPYRRLRNGAVVTAVGSSGEELQASLRLASIVSDPLPPVGAGAKVTLCFGGVGLVFHGMGNEQYHAWPAFRAEVDKLDALFALHVPFVGRSVATECGLKSDVPLPTREKQSVGTELMQAATFVVQYAQAAALLQDFDVEVAAAVGHSFGEVPAAAWAGVLSLEAAVSMTAVRTRACVGLEERHKKAGFGMLVVKGVREAASVQAMIDAREATAHVFLAGWLAADEFLLSGRKASLDALAESAARTEGVSVTRVDSAIPFHTHFMSEMTAAVEKAWPILGSLADQDTSSPLRCDLLLTSCGRRVSRQEVSEASFWTAASLGPILLDSLMSDLAATNSSAAVIDLSPRGLFVNWLKRNSASAEHAALLACTLGAPVFSWDFGRALQLSLKPPEAAKRTRAEATKRAFLPAYPFDHKRCMDLHPSQISATIDGASAFRASSILETVYTPITVTPAPSLAKTRTLLFLQAASNGQCLRDAAGSSATVALSGPEEIVSASQVHPGSVLVLSGPLATDYLLWDGCDDILAAEKLLSALSEVLTDAACRVEGVLCVTGDETHVAFELVKGGVHAIRQQTQGLKFVSTLQIDDLAHGSALAAQLHDAGCTLSIVLAAAADGEEFLRLSLREKALKTMRIVPATRTLSTTALPLESQGLFVVSGSTSGIAGPLVREMVLLGARHFLLLSNSREPAATALTQLRELGAETLLCRKCRLDDVEALEKTIVDAVSASGMERCVGVVHCAVVDSDAVRVSLTELQNVTTVKLRAMINLHRCAKLRPGDVFVCPGSISQLVGSPGIPYTATNVACRAVQRKMMEEGGYACPYPMIGISDEAANKSSLFHGNVASITRATGLMSVATQTVNASLLYAPWTAGGDLVMARVDAERMDDYLNTMGPNKLFSDLRNTQECAVLHPLPAKLAGIALRAEAPTGSGSARGRLLSEREVLVEAIAKVTGMTASEVETAGAEEAYLDEAFSIDSISIVRLTRMLADRGFAMKEVLVSYTFGHILTKMIEMKVQPAAVSTSSPEQPSDTTQPELPDGEALVDDAALPVPAAHMRVLAQGHNTAKETIVPSLWYLINGYWMLKPTQDQEIRCSIMRMAAEDGAAFVTSLRTAGSTPTVAFSSAGAGHDELLVRSEVTVGECRVEEVPIGMARACDFAMRTPAEIQGRLLRCNGFDYNQRYKSLTSVEFWFPDAAEDEPGVPAPLPCSRIEARGLIDVASLQDMSASHRAAEEFCIVADASLQALIVGTSATVAPAKVSMKFNMDPLDWVPLLAATGGVFFVSARYLEFSPHRLEGETTVYVDAGGALTPLLTSRCTCKPLPVAVGADLRAELFCTEPRRTVVCFHETGGSSRVFEPLAAMLAPSGVRVLTVDLPHHGRRSHQIDDRLITRKDEMASDLIPWLFKMLRGPGGGVAAFDVLAVSAGATGAFWFMENEMLPRGLCPGRFIGMTTQPPHFTNEHVERTYACTADNVTNALGYFGMVARVDLQFLNEGQATAERVRSVLGIVHDVTTTWQPRARLAGVKCCMFSVQDDDMVRHADFLRWAEVVDESWIEFHDLGRFHHFVGLTGEIVPCFRKIFFETDGMQGPVCGADHEPVTPKPERSAKTDSGVVGRLERECAAVEHN